MTINTATLRPGLLVSLSSRLTGNINYVKRDLENVVDETGAHAKWETERTIADPAEYERATKARSKALSIIRGVCAKSAFGLLCPESKTDDLEKALLAARVVVDDFNATAQMTRIAIYSIAGRIAPDDVEAVRAISSEVRDLMDEMARGIENVDVKRIRDAADRAKSVGQMLTPDMQARVQMAIDAARKTARAIVQAGEQASQEIDRSALRTLAEQRTAFLDLDGEDKAIEAPEAEARAVDFEPAEQVERASEPTPTFAADLEEYDAKVADDLIKAEEADAGVVVPAIEM